MKCNTKTTLDMAFSLLAGNIKMSRQDRAVIKGAIEDRCVFQEVAKGFLELFDEGLLCCGIKASLTKEQIEQKCGSGDDCCGIMGLAEKARTALGEAPREKKSKRGKGAKRQ